jgi:hypothetical protein
MAMPACLPGQTEEFSMSRRLPFTLAVALCLLAGRLAGAQGEPPQDPGAPAHIAVVQGAAILERNGVGEPAAENAPLLQGDRLRTDDGRLEILLPDGSVLDLDRQTTVDLLAGGLVRLMGGRTIFIVATGPDGAARTDYQIDAPAASVRFTHAGEYRVFTNASNGVPFVEVSVVRGRAVVDADGKSVPLSAGERAQAVQGQGVTAVGSFNSALADVFVEWSELQRGLRVGSRSNAYLPPELQVYGGAFDRNGRWEDSADAGYVWYPSVAADWQPYYDGGWYPYSWGWTWVGGGPWVWPTHHYGRWGRGQHGWYWMPGAVWGPAWVSWGISAGYVGWCPLGFGTGFGFSVGASYGGYADRWHGWTVVPHGAFGRGPRVAPHAVRGDGLRAVERAGFETGRGAPTLPDGAGGRGRTGPRVTPYDRAQAVASQRARSSQGWAQAAAVPRSSAATRTYSAGSSLPATRTAEGAATVRTRSVDPRALSSSSGRPTPYPERYRSTPGTSPQALGSVVPRTAPTRPAESRSPYYYLGPAAPRASGPSPATASPRQPSAPGSRDPDSTRDPRSYSSSPSTPSPSSPEPRSSAGWMADPRPSSSPHPSADPSPGRSSASPRPNSTPGRSVESGPGSSSSGTATGAGGRTPGTYGGRSAGAPAGASSSGMSGGRTPGRAPAAGGGGGRSGGSAGGGRSGRGR